MLFRTSPGLEVSASPKSFQRLKNAGRGGGGGLLCSFIPEAPRVLMTRPRALSKQVAELGQPPDPGRPQ